MNAQETEIYKAHRDAQTRYTYFLLAAVGASIALALNQTREASLSWLEAPLGAAVLLWSVSFIFGIQHVKYVMSSLYANMALLRVQRGGEPSVPQHPDAINAASDGIRAALETNSNRANRYAIWQLRLLIAGALFYVVWHVWQMYLRT
jgi:hypothetical protein